MNKQYCCFAIRTSLFEVPIHTLTSLLKTCSDATVPRLEACLGWGSASYQRQREREREVVYRPPTKRAFVQLVLTDWLPD